jgi:hypothetical protein
MNLKLLSLVLAISIGSQVTFVETTNAKDSIKLKENLSVANIYSGVKFHYLDEEDRIFIVTSFLKKVQLEYVLLPYKVKTLGINLDKMRDEAIQAEKGIGSILLQATERNNLEMRDRVAQEQAKANLDFFDRMSKLVAQFKDTHFGIHTKISRPNVYIGINFYRADGKVIVGSTENKLLGLSSKLSNTNFSAIKPGDEVLAVDGMSIEDKINELKPYINSSSDSYSDIMSIWSLSARNFKYPEKNFVTIKFKDAGTFKLPYFASVAKTSPRIDANIYLSKIGIPTDLTTIGMVYDDNTKVWKDSFATFTGYSTRNLYKNLIGLKEYTDDYGQPAIRTGYFLKQGVAYGVLQLMTFHSEQAVLGDEKVPFMQPIANFINELKANDSDLIIDLRNNGGGNIGYTSDLLSLIAKTGANYPGQTAGYRIVPTIRELMPVYLWQNLPGETLDSTMSSDEWIDLFQNTINEESDYTPMVSNSSVKPDPLVGGYDKKVVALIAPTCISACDITSFILKASGRATLIGTQSNGTGAGFNSNEQITTTWEDDLKVFNTSIPNLLFGLPGSSTDVETHVFEKDSVYRLDSENHPTIADIHYENSVRDILNNNIGWLDKAVEVLKSK